MPSDDLESVEEGFAQTPGEHQVEHLMHLTCQHRPDRARQHGETLEDGGFEGSILLSTRISGIPRGRHSPPLSEMILDDLDDIVYEWSHFGRKLDSHVTEGDVRCSSAMICQKHDSPISRSVGLPSD